MIEIPHHILIRKEQAMTKGERIKNARLSAGLSQVELAQKIHTTKQNIYKYETGIITNIPSDKIEAMASVLDVTPEYLMGWEDFKAGQTAKYLKELPEGWTQLHGMTYEIPPEETKELAQLLKDFSELTRDQQLTVLALIHSMTPNKEN